MIYLVHQYTVLMSAHLSHWIWESNSVHFNSLFILCLCHFLGPTSALPSAEQDPDPLVQLL